MMRYTQSLSKIFLLLLTLSFQSCTKETIINLDEETYEWQTDDPPKSTFVMVDNNGISQVFTLKSNHRDYIISTSSSLGSTTITKEENIYQQYLSDFGNEFEIFLRTGIENYGDDIYFECAKIGFAYDPKYKTLIRVNTYFGNLGQPFNTNGGGYLNGLLSHAEILNHYSTRYHEYDQVMYFNLKDLKEKWDNKTVVKIYIAKKIGLIKYELNNGIYYERK